MTCAISSGAWRLTATAKANKQDTVTPSSPRNSLEDLALVDEIHERPTPKVKHSDSTHWSRSTVRKYSKPYLRTQKWPTWHPSVLIDFIRLGSATTNRKNELTGEQLAVGTDSRSGSTGPSRMFSILTEGCHVGHSREFVGTVYCTYGLSNTTTGSIEQQSQAMGARATRPIF